MRRGLMMTLMRINRGWWTWTERLLETTSPMHERTNPLATVAQLLRCLLLRLVIKLDPESSTHMKASLRHCDF